MNDRHPAGRSSCGRFAPPPGYRILIMVAPHELPLYAVVYVTSDTTQGIVRIHLTRYGTGSNGRYGTHARTHVSPHSLLPIQISGQQFLPHRMLELAHRLRLNLPNALASNVEFLADLFQRVHILAKQALASF